MTFVYLIVGRCWTAGVITIVQQIPDMNCFFTARFRHVAIIFCLSFVMFLWPHAFNELVAGSVERGAVTRVKADEARREIGCDKSEIDGAPYLSPARTQWKSAQRWRGRVNSAVMSHGRGSDRGLAILGIHFSSISSNVITITASSTRHHHNSLIQPHHNDSFIYCHHHDSLNHPSSQ